MPIEEQDPNEALLRFFYRAPVGIVQTRGSGEIEMLTPVASKLLMPLVQCTVLDNLFTALDPVVPDLRERVAGFQSRSGSVVKAMPVQAPADRAGRPSRRLSLSLLKIDEDCLMTVLCDLPPDSSSDAAPPAAMPSPRFATLPHACRHGAMRRGAVLARRSHWKLRAATRTPRPVLQARGRASGALARLAQAHHELLSFLYRTPTGMVQTNLAGDVELISPVAAKWLMPLVAEARLDNLFEALSSALPQLPAMVAQCTQRVGVVCEAQQVRIEGPDSGGPAQILSISVLKLDEAHLMTSLSDVTSEVQRIEARQLADSRKIASLSASLTHALEVSELSVSREDLRSGMVHCSPQLLAWLGKDAARPVLPVGELQACIHAPDREMFLADRTLALEGGQAMLREFRYRAQDGRIGYFTGGRLIERDTQGAPLILTTFLVEVSRQRQAELELRQAQAADEGRRVAEAANHAKSEFLSRLSHDLRSPLGGIVGLAGLLERSEGTVPPLKRQHQLRLIQKSGQHLLCLVNDLLDLSRIEIGQFQVHLMDVDLRDTVRVVLEEQTIEAQARGVSLIDLLVPGDPPWVRADPTRLRQVLTNLVSNAIKYNRPGGQVILHAERTASGWSINVSDTGIGISSDQLAVLFEPFNRLGRESSGFQGVGLGLVITRQLTLAMGGQLTVSSEPGVGSTFQIQLQTGAASQDALAG